jgi:predicted transcriptional regulator
MVDVTMQKKIPNNRLAALDTAIVRGIADAEAGRVKPLSEIFDRLEARYRSRATKDRRPARNTKKQTPPSS